MTDQEKPEVIFKEAYCIDGSSDEDIPTPMLVILANHEGFLWLAEYFQFQAERAQAEMIAGIQFTDNALHLSSNETPFNKKYSDHIELLVGAFDSSNRDHALNNLAHCGALKLSQCGSLVSRYQRIICDARKSMEKLG